MLIFDKSTLQSLSLDEAVWLENFFSTNITPLFFIETLADLSKKTHGRSAETLVVEIARKAPLRESFPNAFHHPLVGNDLMGRAVPMTHQVVVTDGILKRSPEGNVGTHHGESDEAAAFQRWQRGEFHELERLVARSWRTALETTDFRMMIARALDITGERRLDSLEEARASAAEVTARSGMDVVRFAIDFLGLSESWRREIEPRYEESQAPLSVYAPYASFVLEVALTFYLAMASHLISRERKSNMVDVAYLYYLPFCQAFVSHDKLHARTAPAFLDSQQSFVDGKSLKSALRELVEYYAARLNAIEKVGIARFAHRPPKDFDNAVTDLWDMSLPGWREMPAGYDPKHEGLVRSEEMTPEKLTILAETSVPIAGPAPESSGDYSLFVRKVPVRRGRWRVLPPEAEPK